MIVLEVSGRGARKAFRHENGGHRWQRVPPTEKKGRRHTSTVTVAVMPVAEGGRRDIEDKDVEWVAMRGSGAGGQARNKTSNAVKMTHRQTGISVRVETSRSQWENREIAKRLLLARIEQEATEAINERGAQDRKNKIGSGQRGDKIRTVRTQDNRVTDHRLGVSVPAHIYLAGDIASLIDKKGER